MYFCSLKTLNYFQNLGSQTSFHKGKFIKFQQICVLSSAYCTTRVESYETNNSKSLNVLISGDFLDSFKTHFFRFNIVLWLGNPSIDSAYRSGGNGGGAGVGGP